MQGLLGRKKPDASPSACVGRYVCWKISWRGRYRRVIYITPFELVTFDPTVSKITNAYSLGPNDPDIDGVQLGSGGGTGQQEDEGEVIINARGDKKV